MGTEKRDRQKANKAAKQEAERAAAAKAKRNQTIRSLTILAVVVIAIFVIWGLTGCSSSGSEGTAKGPAAPTSTTFPAYGSTTCAPADGVDEPVIDFTSQFRKCIDPDKTYTATFDTTEGTVVVELDTERTPIATNNFVNLARSGFYDDTDLFRTEANTGIIQGGSPHSQDNTDPGPGYDIRDEGGPFTSADYAPGTIAMANSGQPNSSGAQFFFLANEGGAYLGDTAQLGPSAGTYTVFGKTTEGLDVLEAIAALDNGTGAPGKQVTINSVTIDES